MRKFLSLSLLLLIMGVAAPHARADIENAPFIPEIDRRFNAIEQGNHYQYSKFPMGSADGHWTQQAVQATYNFATMGGAISYQDLGISLPAGAVVTQAGAWSLTKPTTSASGTLAFTCGASPVFTFLNATAAASYASAAAAIAGNSNGTITNWSTITTKCDINALIATGALTAGKVTLFVNYWMHQ